MTTREPGARLVLTQGGTLSPRSTAFLATRPAAIMTDGLEVFVQLVIAEITTVPSPSSASPPFSFALTLCCGPLRRPATNSPNLPFVSPSASRSCGLLGPATEGRTVPISSSSVAL